jgi:hypothetical protein
MERIVLVAFARRYLISDTGLSEANLIRKVQIAQGHCDCFATGKPVCDERACPWRNDCLTEPDDGCSTLFSQETL